MSLRQQQGLEGTTIDGRYRVESRLGEGGFGAVFKGYQLALERDVAIKVLHGTALGTKAVKRFEREAKSLARLDHPNCVRVIDFGTLEDGAPYLVMEFIVGASMIRELGQPWPITRALEVLQQLLEGLDHAHRLGLVHRDLKPANVLLTEDEQGREQVKIIDFGIVKLVTGEAEEPQPALTLAGGSPGTPGYMSPEQGAGGKIDTRSDLYNVGLLAYEMLTGAPPFVGQDAKQLVWQHAVLTHEQLPERVPEQLRNFVDRLLAKSAAQRFDSARVALQQLRRLELQLDANEQPTLTSGATLDLSSSENSATFSDVESSQPVLAQRYRVLRQIGAGGMGEVYLAEHETLGIQVAVKILSPELCSKPAAIERFMREVKTSSRISHQNVVEITDFGYTGDTPYYVMEYLDGETLSARLEREGPLPWPRVRHIMLHILAALEAAHAQGVVHRDVKPGNCIVLERGDDSDFVKVVDFGIAKVINEDSELQSLTKAGSLVGTLQYMSPEQALGERIDHRCDIYSAGIIAYRLLTGCLPFSDTNMVRLVHKVVSEPPPPMSEIGSVSVHPRVEELVLQALAKDPNQRFASASDFSNALRVLPEELPSGHRRRDPSMPPATFSLASELAPISLVEVSVPMAPKPPPEPAEPADDPQRAPKPQLLVFAALALLLLAGAGFLLSI